MYPPSGSRLLPALTLVSLISLLLLFALAGTAIPATAVSTGAIVHGGAVIIRNLQGSIPKSV